MPERREVIQGYGITIEGLPQLQKALERVGGGRANFGVEYELQHRLRNIGERVAEASREFVPHRTGRHGDRGLPPLEDTLKVSVAVRRSTIYTDSPYSRVQQFGGGPKSGWSRRGPHVQRANASKWLTKGVASQRAYVDQEAEAVLDWIAAEWNK